MMFKVGYLLAPLLSAWLGYIGWPWWAILIGMGCGLAMLALDVVSMALRARRSGIGGRFFGMMMQPLLAMMLPAAVWNSAGYGIGLLVAHFLA